MKAFILAHTDVITDARFHRKVYFLMIDGEKIKEKFFTVFSDMTDFAVRIGFRKNEALYCVFRGLQLKGIYE